MALLSTIFAETLRKPFILLTNKELRKKLLERVGKPVFSLCDLSHD